MTDATRTGLTLDDGQTTWDVLSGRVEALRRRWDDAHAPPPLLEFVPEGSPSLRRIYLTELVKADLECRWSRRQPRPLEEYVAEFPELAGPSGLPCDLILREFQLRKRLGEPVNAEEYARRFPAQATELARLLTDTVATVSGSADRN